MILALACALAAPLDPTSAPGLDPAVDTSDTASPPEDPPRKEIIDVMYRWDNPVTGERARGWTTIRLRWWEDEGLAPECRRWGSGWCGVGEFTTDDGGTGVVELAVAKEDRRRVRTIALVYDDTGAMYDGVLRLNDPDDTWLGVLSLAGDRAWEGLWDEPERVESVRDRARADRGTGRPGRDGRSR